MKRILIAAALAATPALAQTTSPNEGATNGTAGQSMPSGQMSQSGTPMGGYQPQGSAMSGQPTPGAPVTFQQAPSPAQAYPAPAALDHYPPCKPGQYDQCMQTNGSHRAKHMMVTSHHAARRAMPMKKTKPATAAAQ